MDKASNNPDTSEDKSKREEKRALEIMMEKSCPENDQSFIILAIEFNILDFYINKYIEKAGSIKIDKISAINFSVMFSSTIFSCDGVNCDFDKNPPLILVMRTLTV